MGGWVGEGGPTQGFSENENEDHPDKEALLLAHRTDTGVPHHANGNASGQGAVLLGIGGWVVEKEAVRMSCELGLGGWVGGWVGGWERRKRAVLGGKLGGWMDEWMGR